MSTTSEPPGPDAGPTAAVTLPDAVRRRTLELAAQVLGALPEAEVPASLQRVGRFAPGQRASAGATPLASALERHAGFRAAVASAVREGDPELAAAVATGEVPPATDPVQVAAIAYLLRDGDWPARLGRAVEDLRERAAAEAARGTAGELAQLRTAADTATRRLGELREQTEAAARSADEELASLRRELRRHRSDADRARAQARSAAQAAAEATEQARRVRAEAELAQAHDEVATLRRADRVGRSLAGSRARLLLDTVVDAAAGLRSELGQVRRPTCCRRTWSAGSRPPEPAVVRSVAPRRGPARTRTRQCSPSC